jgi:hypothetical protein
MRLVLTLQSGVGLAFGPGICAATIFKFRGTKSAEPSNRKESDVTSPTGADHAVTGGCGHFLMFLKLRNSVLIDLLPELFPSALCEDEGSKA